MLFPVVVMVHPEPSLYAFSVPPVINNLSFQGNKLEIDILGHNVMVYRGTKPVTKTSLNIGADGSSSKAKLC